MRPPRLLPAAACLAILLAGLAPLPALAGEGGTAELAWSEAPGAGYGSRDVALDLASIPGLKPVESKANVRYASLDVVGEAHLLVALETTDQPLLWVDADFDGDLSKEKPVRLLVEEDAPTGTATVRVRHPLAARGSLPEVPLLFTFTPAKAAVPAKGETPEQKAVPTKLTVSVRAHRAGTIELDGRLRAVRLVDGNADLGFGDDLKDRMWLDVDGDLRLRGDRDAIKIAVAFRVLTRGYVATVPTADGASVRFEATPELPAAIEPRWAPRKIPPSGVVREVASGAFEAAKKAYEAYLARPHPPSLNPVQQARLDALQRAGSKRAFHYLLGIYKEARRVDVRVAALRATGSGNFKALASRVARIAKEDQPVPVRIAALDAMHAAGYPKRDKVVAQILAKFEPKRRGDEKLVEALIKHLGYARTDYGRNVLNKALKRAKLPEDISRLYGAIRDSRTTPLPRKTLVEQVIQSKKARLRAHGLEDAHRRRLLGLRDLALAQAAMKFDDPVLARALVEILGSGAEPDAVGALFRIAERLDNAGRGRLVQMLSAMREARTAAVLAPAVAAPSPVVRAMAAEVLGHWPGPEAPRLLTERLGVERDRSVLNELLESVGVLRCQAAVDAILAVAARESKDENLPWVATFALAKIGFADARVAPFFLARMKGRPWDQRVDILDAAAAGGHAGALAVLEPSLADADRRVRLGAVEGLGQLRVRGAIKPLFARLAVEDDKRIRDAIAHTLFLTTGQYFYDDLAVWTRWWKDKGSTFAVPKEIPALKVEVQEGTYATTFYGVPVSSERIVFVVDQSGSMAAPHIGPKGEVEGRTQWEKAVEEMAGVIKTLGDGARLNIICFESGIQAWKPRLVELNVHTRKELAKWLARLEPENGTNLWDGLERALTTRDVDAIYLLSDGAPNGGRWRSQRDILRETAKLNRRNRAAIHCVSLGRESALLKALAKDNGGIYVRR